MSVSSPFLRRLPWILVTVFGMASLYLFLLTRSLMFSPPDHPVDQRPEYDEIWSWGTQGEAKVVRIPLDGVIMRSSPMLLGGSSDMVASFKAQVRAATEDEEVRAILVEVNSPGGGVTPSDEIHRALLDFKASREDRKVVVLCRDLMASGGYYVAMAADHIVAEPTSLIGSIGVLIQSFNVHEVMQKVGVKDVTVISSKSDNKDILSPFKDVDPAQTALLLELVDEMYDRFSGLVKAGRGLDDATLDAYADGRIFTAQFALEKGFVDEIGYFEDALAGVEKALGVTDLHVVRYNLPRSLMESVLGVEAESFGVSLPGWADSGSPQLMYLWK